MNHQNAKLPAIVVVAKVPAPGLVKTRLISPLTPRQSCDLYARFLEDTIKKALKIPEAALFLALNLREPGCGYSDLYSCLTIPDSITIVDQGSGSLGERLAYLSELVFAHADRLVFIGADSPTLPLAYIEAAISGLPANDLVIGPSNDGGYYLLGLAGHYPVLFEGVDWSTDAVFEQTLERAAIARLTVKVLPRWYDIDDAEDLLLLEKELSEDPSAAPSTAAFLKNKSR
ncbi:MAG: TIGR04282 family arsenosugar biosynthesis glycosyltransferase [Actinobacteria bacterium]|nr:TIGR04282 family arsenosugar biosynthesis glycosyltransferase [Actinomycetota bacterium]